MNNASAAALVELQQAAATLLTSDVASSPLKSIFSEVASSDADPPPAFFAARPLSIARKVLFPLPDPEQARTNAVPDLAARFREAYAVLPQDDELRLAQLYYLLHQYAWAVPSGTDEALSLFDQARTNAALAAAKAADPSADGVVLVGGDISGVQSFLYMLTAAGATRALRGRSFYLQMLTDALARYVLQQAEMPLTNLLYSGGGRFYIIVPGHCQPDVARWRYELGQLLLRRHTGELYLALGATAFKQAALDQSPVFGQHWRELQEAINLDKRRRFAGLDAATLVDELFTPQGHGGGVQAACVVCRYQGEQNEFVTFKQDVEEGRPAEQQRRICRLCASFDDVARDLHNARFLVLQHTASELPGQKQRVAALHVLRDLGVNITLAQKEETLRHALPNSPAVVLALRDPASAKLRDQFRSQSVVWGFRPLVNETATILLDDVAELKDWVKQRPEEAHTLEAERVKTFGMLTQQSEGIKRLGVLRMDVDDLGDLFAYSLRHADLARISALSAALSRFFEGWVGELCHRVNHEYGQRVYAVYSGGDDLFIVGSWHILPELARRIRQDLQAYALNDLVHVSAGLSLHGATFPLYQAAEAAGAALDAAKARDGKDAFSFLDQTIKWGQPADDLFSLQRQLIAYIDGKHLNRSILQVLQELYSQYLQPYKQKGRTKRPDALFFGPWMYRGAYQLKRMAEAHQHHPEVAAFLDDLRLRLTEKGDSPAGQGERFIERIGLAARWAQLQLRKEER